MQKPFGPVVLPEVLNVSPPRKSNQAVEVGGGLLVRVWDKTLLFATLSVSLD